jgi:hypothetical protein
LKPKSVALLIWLTTALALLAGSGASCQRASLYNPFTPAGPAAPYVLQPGASREQIVAAVNQNSSRIRSLSATGATITIPDTMNLPLLTANIAAERPGRIRLTAGTAVTGQEMDLGSNDELFWMWIRRNEPPAIYYCRHDQFANSAIRQMMPIEPRWLLAAIGMTDIDPASIIDGPLPRGDGTVEIRTLMPTVSGTLNRVLVIDANRAWVVEQHVYDQTGQTLLASAVAETHQYYPAEQVSLPQRLSLRLPTAGLAMKIDLGTMQINQLSGDPAQLWTMPTMAGYPQVDLGGALPNTPLNARPATGYAPTTYAPAPNPPNVAPAAYYAPPIGPR